MLDLQTVCTLNHTKIFDDIFVVFFFFAYFRLLPPFSCIYGAKTGFDCVQNLL